MPEDDDRVPDEAPDIQFLGEQVVFQPSGVEPVGKDGEDGALMKPLGRFRSDPLQYVACPSLCTYV